MGRFTDWLKAAAQKEEMNQPRVADYDLVPNNINRSLDAADGSKFDPEFLGQYMQTAESRPRLDSVVLEDVVQDPEKHSLKRWEISNPFEGTEQLHQNVEVEVQDSWSTHVEVEFEGESLIIPASRVHEIDGVPYATLSAIFEAKRKLEESDVRHHGILGMRWGAPKIPPHKHELIRLRSTRKVIIMFCRKPDCLKEFAYHRHAVDSMLRFNVTYRQQFQAS